MQDNFSVKRSLGKSAQHAECPIDLARAKPSFNNMLPFDAGSRHHVNEIVTFAPLLDTLFAYTA